MVIRYFLDISGNCIRIFVVIQPWFNVSFKYIFHFYIFWIQYSRGKKLRDRYIYSTNFLYILSIYLFSNLFSYVYIFLQREIISCSLAYFLSMSMSTSIDGLVTSKTYIGYLSIEVNHFSSFVLPYIVLVFWYSSLIAILFLSFFAYNICLD